MNSGLVRSIAGLSSRWRNRFSRSTESSEHIRFGASGERLATRFLRKNGYKILYRNFKNNRGGEIDIVCRDQETLVFVEVKTRGGEEFARPFAAVDREKRRFISRGGLAWLRMLDNPEIAFRFDVVEVVIDGVSPPRFELIQNAFQLSAPYIY